MLEGSGGGGAGAVKAGRGDAPGGWGNGLNLSAVRGRWDEYVLARPVGLGRGGSRSSGSPSYELMSETILSSA